MLAKRVKALGSLTALSDVPDAIRNAPKIKSAAIAELFQAGLWRVTPGSYFPALRKAEDALADWKVKYPEAAKQEYREHLVAQAAALKDKAKGALLWDMDGSLSAADRQRRHDEMIAEAEALIAKANSL